MITNIIRHELRHVLTNSRSWYMLAFVFAVLGTIFNWLMNLYLQDQLIDENIAYGVTEAVIHPFFAWFGLISLILIPSITTQYLCGEKNRQTLINYYFSKITPTQLFLGKLYTLGILLAMILISISLIPMTILLSGGIDLGHFFACILGVYLMLWVALAVGLCVSAFMQNILRSTFVIFCSLLIFVMIEWAAQFSKQHVLFLQQFALLKPLKSFLAGVITPAYILYYLLILIACVIIGSWRIESGKFYD